jgi:aromatic-L-amino-acid/L-tryptophan decarboxylase
VSEVAVLAESVKPQLSGIERADSIALDLHKWRMHIPCEAGCVLIRHNDAHRSTFTLTPDYLAHESRGLAAEVIRIGQKLVVQFSQ